MHSLTVPARLNPLSAFVTRIFNFNLACLQKEVNAKYTIFREAGLDDDARVRERVQISGLLTLLALGWP
jgi:hypothetical protein